MGESITISDRDRQKVLDVLYGDENCEIGNGFGVRLEYIGVDGRTRWMVTCNYCKRTKTAGHDSRCWHVRHLARIKRAIRIMGGDDS